MVVNISSRSVAIPSSQVSDSYPGGGQRPPNGEEKSQSLRVRSVIPTLFNQVRTRGCGQSQSLRVRSVIPTCKGETIDTIRRPVAIPSSQVSDSYKKRNSLLIPRPSGSQSLRVRSVIPTIRKKFGVSPLQCCRSQSLRVRSVIPTGTQSACLRYCDMGRNPFESGQ